MDKHPAVADKVESRWRRLALVSCTHCGSNTGLFPDKYITPEGNTILPSPGQRMLKDMWDEFWAGPAKDADTVVHLGDVCQGVNRKGFGKGTITAELERQATIAAQVMEPVCAGRRGVWFVRGSNYHGSLDMSLEKHVALAVGGTWLGLVSMRRLVGPEKNVLFAHGKNSPLVYQSTFEDRESLFLDAAIGSGQWKNPVDYVIKGHWHKYGVLDMGHRVMIRVPGWQAWYDEPFMVDNIGKKHSWIGGVVLDIGPGMAEYQVHKSLWPQPEILLAMQEG